MTITVIGSHCCPDTLAALNELKRSDVEIDFKDILSSHSDLKAYLKLRDQAPLYEHIKGTDSLGIPCFIREDGSLTLNLREIL